MASLVRRSSLLFLPLVALSLPAASARSEVGDWSRLPLTRGVHYHTVVHDAVHHRLIAFGGFRNAAPTNEVYILPLEGPPVWQWLEPAGTRPVGRSSAGVIYDPVRDRLLVHGGQGATGGVRTDLWQLTLGATPTWTQLSPLGPAPAARSGHLAVYDPPRDRLLVFGGTNGTVRLNDVWSLPLADASAWVAITPTGTPPSARWGHAGAYDAQNDRLVIHGGNDVGPPMADTWGLSLAGTPAWTNLIPAGTPPVGRYVHTGTYDPIRKRFVIFGGFNGTVSLNDAWALDLNGAPTWAPIAAAGLPPSPRFATGWIYDAPRDRTVLFGGATGVSVDDVWYLTFAGSPAWQNGLPASTNAAWRYYHDMALDPVNQKVWLFGGYDGSIFGDLKSLTLTGGNRWSAISATGGPPAARRNHKLTYDPVRHRLILFGGVSNTPGVLFNDVWALSLTGSPHWTQLTPSGTPPTPRASVTACYDPLRDRIVYFGGSLPSAGGRLNQVWALSLAGGGAWSLLTPSGSPPEGRDNHAAVYDPVRDRMLVSGGQGQVHLDLSDMWALSLAGGTAWSILPPSASHMRTGHLIVYDPEGDRIVMHGGLLSGVSHPGTYEMLLSAENPAPQLLSPGGPQPVARASHAGVYDPAGKRLIMFGGMPTNDAEVWSLPLFEGTLSAPPAANATDVQLAPAHPSPARGEVTLGFTLPAAGHAKLRIYDVTGRHVVTLADGLYAAGPHTLRWDRRSSAGDRMRAGLYFFELDAGGTKLSKRVALVE